MQRSHNGLDHTISTVVKHSGMESFFDAYCTSPLLGIESYSCCMMCSACAVGEVLEAFVLHDRLKTDLQYVVGYRDCRGKSQPFLVMSRGAIHKIRSDNTAELLNFEPIRH